MEPGMESTIIAAVVALIIGFFLGRRMAPGSQETRELESKLDEAKAHQERYESRVNAHFADTASKLNALTQNYRDVYEHLASGASDLCSKDGAAQFTALAAPETEDTGDSDEVIEQESVVVEPPRDYAPKTSPDDPGVLNERFGLEGSEDTPPEESSKRDA